MLSLLVVALFVSSDVVLDLLVLFKQEPEHAIKFLRRLYLHFTVTSNRSELLLEVDNSLDIMWLE